MQRYVIPAILMLTLVGPAARAQDDTAWVRYYSAEQPVMGRAVAVAGTAVYTAGMAQNDNQDFFVFKYSGGGDSLWLRHYDLGSDEMAVAVRADGAGNLLVAVLSEGDPQELIIAKLDPAGDTLWTRRQPGFMPTALAVGADNAVYAWSHSGHPAPFDTLALLKYSADGTQLWARRYRFGMQNRAAGCGWVDGGIIALAGVEDGGMKQMVLRFDAEGETTWTRTFEGIGMAEVSSVAPAPERGFYVSATEGGMLKLLRCDPDGGLLWMRDFATQLPPETYSNLATDEFDNVYFASQTPSMAMGFACVNPEGEELFQAQTEVRAEVRSIAVDEMNQPVVVGTAMEGGQSAVTVKFAWAPGISSPAPDRRPAGPFGATLLGNGMLSFSLLEAGRWEAMLYGADGRIAARLHAGHLPAGEHRFRVGRLAAGSYTLVVSRGDTRLSAKVVLPE